MANLLVHLIAKLADTPQTRSLAKRLSYSRIGDRSDVALYGYFSNQMDKATKRCLESQTTRHIIRLASWAKYSISLGPTWLHKELTMAGVALARAKRVS